MLRARAGRQSSTLSPGMEVSWRRPFRRVFLADDETKVRSALRLLLEQALGLVVAAEAAESCGLLARVVAAQPDLLLVDWELPGLRPGEFLAALRGRCGRLKMIALSGDSCSRQAALDAGVDGFACKGDSPERLLATLRHVAGRVDNA